MKPTERDARAGASVVGGKREFALSHPRIYPTPSSQGAGLRYHPCRPGIPRPSVFSPAFFSPIGRPFRRLAGDAPFADRTRVGVRFRRIVFYYPALFVPFLHFEKRSRFYRRKRPPSERLRRIIPGRNLYFRSQKLFICIERFIFWQR